MGTYATNGTLASGAALGKDGLVLRPTGCCVGGQLAGAPEVWWSEGCAPEVCSCEAAIAVAQCMVEPRVHRHRRRCAAGYSCCSVCLLALGFSQGVAQGVRFWQSATCGMRVGSSWQTALLVCSAEELESARQCSGG